MKEFKTILAEFKKAENSFSKAAVATVVRVRGSSYRSPGARMFITDDGRWVGSISGGCLEGDALRKARQVMNNNKPIVVTYDTREESNQTLGIGLGCNGVIDILIESANMDYALSPVNIFKEVVQLNEVVALATFLSGNSVGSKVLLNGEGNILSPEVDQLSIDTIRKNLVDVFTTRRSEVRPVMLNNEEVDVFFELIQPAIKLMIFGAGFDARPVSALAKSLGWEVEVTDECVAHIAPVFFPGVDKLSLCERNFIDRDFDVTPYTACVLMSHNYEYDRDVLRKLLATAAPYIGILGPRKRFDKMKDEFSSQGLELSSTDYERIHSPIGLDIGAEAADEIAVSIVAEIQARISGRSGGFLRTRQAPIHERRASTDEVFKYTYFHRAGA